MYPHFPGKVNRILCEDNSHFRPLPFFGTNADLTPVDRKDFHGKT
ncbi:hypothetical protein M079_2171 [Bacteroides fragilis str. 3996 N(B) 6]|nr:hypothetical protein M079_2171 [Bacteroides fragilis str. 3996 N(B) 6]